MQGFKHDFILGRGNFWGEHVYSNNYSTVHVVVYILGMYLGPELNRVEFDEILDVFKEAC